MKTEPIEWKTGFPETRLAGNSAAPGAVLPRLATPGNFQLAPLWALVWELLWKNRILVPTLLGLLGLGSWLAGTVAMAPEELWTQPYRMVGLTVALASIILGFTPFLLIESHGGWRMSSTATRWLTLPVPTLALALAPLALGWVCLSLLFWAWTPFLRQLLPFLDQPYVWTLMICLMTITQTTSWIAPRKPAQFFTLMTPVYLAALWLAFVPAERPQWPARREDMMGGLWAVTVVFAGLAALMAKANRRGIWPGGVMWETFLPQTGWLASRRRPYRSPLSAMLWSEAMPLWRPFAISWLALAVLISGIIYFSLSGRPKFDPRWVWYGCFNVLPMAAIVWLAPWGLVAACESPGVFKTHFSAYRACQPLNAGALMAPRLLAMLSAYLLVWVPLLILLPWHQSISASLGEVKSAMTFYHRLAWCMALSAHVMAGALPLLFSGRLEGFPNLLVPSMASWAVTYAMGEWLAGDENHAPALTVLGGLLALKILLAGGALALGIRRGHITGTFAGGLLTGWILLAGILAGPVGQAYGAREAMNLMLLLPLARFSWSPLAGVINRHR